MGPRAGRLDIPAASWTSANPRLARVSVLSQAGKGTGISRFVTAFLVGTACKKLSIVDELIFILIIIIGISYELTKNAIH